MAFDPSTATPVGGATKMKFDPSTARPLDLTPKAPTPEQEEQLTQLSGFTPQQAAAKVAAEPRSMEPQRSDEPQRPVEAQEIEPGVKASSVAEINQKQALKRSVAGEGAVFDPKGELPLAARARASEESDPKKQAGVLQSKGWDSWYDTASGEVLTRLPGENGQPDRVVTLHPKDGSVLGKLAGAVGPLQRLGLQGAAAAMTGGGSLLAQGVVQGAVAGGTTLTQEAGSRLEAGQDVELPKVAKDAAVEAGVNAAIPVTVGALSKTAQAATNFTRGAAAQKGVKAAAEDLGVQLPLATKTGSKALAQAGIPEADKSLLAGSLKAAEDRATGGSSVIEEAPLASRVKPILAGAEAESKTAATDAMQTAAKEAGARVNIPAAGTPVEADVEAIKGLGAYVKAAKDRANEAFPPIFKQADAEGLKVDPKPLENLQNAMKEEGPAVSELAPGKTKAERFITKDTKPLREEGEVILYGPEGEPIPQAEIARPKSLEEAVRQRALLRKIIDTPDAAGLGSANSAYARRLHKAVNEQIQSIVGPEGSGSPELKAAWKAATDDYRNVAETLQKGNLRKFLPEADDIVRGADVEASQAASDLTPNSPIVARLASGGPEKLSELRAWKEVLGGNYDSLRSQVIKYMQGGTDRLGNVDAGAFLKKLEGMDPDVKAELFGPSTKFIEGNAKLLARAQGVKIPDAELQDALASAPNLIAKKLTAAIEKEIAHQTTFEEGLLKQIRNGTIDDRVVANDRFTSYLSDHASADGVKQVLGMIKAKSPEMVEPLQNRVLRNLLDSSRMAENETLGARLVSPQKLDEVLSGVDRAKYEALLGSEKMKFLEGLQEVSTGLLKTAAKAGGKSARAAAGDIAGMATGSPQSTMRTLESLGETKDSLGTFVGGIGAKALPLKAAQKYQWVRNYLETGKLPQWTETAKEFTLAATPAAESTKAILAGDSDKTPESRKLPLAKKP